MWCIENPGGAVQFVERPPDEDHVCAALNNGLGCPKPDSGAPADDDHFRTCMCHGNLLR
jgi:hypothetical protein